MLSSKTALWRLNGPLFVLTALFVVVWLAPAFYTVQGLASYLPLHMAAETFSIVISMLVFGVAWNVYSAERPGNFVILACALLAVGLIDFAHMLSFKGMPDFITPSGPEKAINLWLAARLLAALTLFTLSLRHWQPLRHPQNRYGLLAGSLAVSAIVIWSGLAHPEDWPRTFIAGQGLTAFKIAAEYSIIALLIVPAVQFYRQSRRPQPYDVASLFAATVVTILSELCFTLYSDVADIFNLLGHIYKVVAYIYIYRAVFMGSVREPFLRLDAEVEQNRRIAKELRTASIYTRSLIEASLDPLVTISSDGKITDVNHATEKATGRSRSELIGTDFSDYFTDPDLARKGYQRVFQDGFVTDYPLAVRHRDGRITEVLYNASVYRDEEGKVLGVFAAARDVTERHAADFLRAQLADIVEFSNDAIIGKTPDGIITSWNKAAERIYGYSAEEILGKSITALAPPELHAEISGLLGQIRNGGIVVNRESERIRKDGSRIHVELTLSPIKDASGRITGISTIARDITARKLAEEALRQSEEKYRTLVQQIQVAVVVHGADTQILISNPMAQQLLGLSEDQVRGRMAIDPAWHFYAEDGSVLPLDDYPVNRVLASRNALRNFIVGVHRPNQDDIWALVNAVPVFGKAGDITQVIVTFIDVSERKRMENALFFVSQRGWRIIGEHFFDALAQFLGERLNMDYVLIDRIDENPEMAETVALYAKGAITPNMRYALKGTPCENVMGKSMCVYSHGIQQLFPEDTLLPGMGAESYVGIPLWDSTGRPIGLIAVMSSKPLADAAPVTQVLQLVATRAAAELERRQVEEKVRRLNQELEQRVAERTAQLEDANKELEAFAYSVSHDLRTPLRAIDGFSHILQEDYAGKLDEEGNRVINVVRDNASRMGHLIDDILQFSRTGRLGLNFAEIDVKNLAQEVFEELKPVFAGGKVQIEIGDIPSVTGDRAMLRQVFVNLLSNACKFSSHREAAKVQVGGSVENGEAIYFVRDNGVGFDMQYVGKLFGVFQRLHSVEEFEGTGIGLAIVKRIITRHGGRVWAEGKVNEGAAFFFALPIRQK